MLKNSSENTEEKSKGYRNIENGKEKVIEDINVIYHLPKGYKHIHKCLDDPKSPVRKDLLDILNYLKKKDPIIYHQQYVYYLQARLKDNILSYEAIKAFCFPEKMNLQENETLKMIEEQGLKAFKRTPGKEFVELHHEKGVIPAKDNQEALNLLPENSDLKHINFLRSTVHDILDGLGAYHKATDPEEKVKILAEKVADKDIKEPLFILPGDRTRTGTVASLINQDDQNIIIYTNPLLKKGDILDDTTVKILQNLVNKTDRPQEVYKDINGTLYRLLAFRRQKKDLEKLKIAVEIE